MIDESISALRKLNMSVPMHMRLPTVDEVAQAEAAVGISFTPELKKYLLEASDVVFGTIEPVTVTKPGSRTDLRKVAAAAHKAGVPKDWLPMAEDNSDYFCVLPDGSVRFWSQDGKTSEAWTSLSSWIDDVWLES